jgi:hypothetical protein
MVEIGYGNSSRPHQRGQFWIFIGDYVIHRILSRRQRIKPLFNLNCNSQLQSNVNSTLQIRQLLIDTMVGVEVILGIIGCIACSLGGTFCFVQEEEKKRKQRGLSGSLCGPNTQEQQYQQQQFQQMQELHDLAQDRDNRIDDLENFIKRERAIAYSKYQQQQAQGFAAAALPAAPAPAMGGALQNPAARPLVFVQAPVSPYANQPYFQPQPMAPNYQMRNYNAPLAGAPIYYAR